MTATTDTSVNVSGIVAEQQQRVEGNRHRLARHDHLAGRVHVGPVDTLPMAEILALLPKLPVWPEPVNGERNLRLRGATRILRWLLHHPGDGWQARWVAAGADAGVDWFDDVAPHDARKAETRRDEIRRGLVCLLLCRVVLPGYDMLYAYKAFALFSEAQQVLSPEEFEKVRLAAAELKFGGTQIADTLVVVTKMILHTGKTIAELTTEDIFELRAWHQRRWPGRPVRGLYLVWDVLRHIGVLTVTTTLRAALREGQRPTSELVDRYQIQNQGVRDLLVRYLDQRRPAMDYSAFRTLAGVLVGLFWADIQRHHPGIDTINLPPDVADAWKQRLRFIRRPGQEPRPRRGYLDILQQIRSFYLDLQEWALEDPSWAQWAVPCPIRRGETFGMSKQKKVTTARMHQRVRERLPHLPVLLDTARRRADEQAALLAAAAAAEPDEAFRHHGTHYRRVMGKTRNRTGQRWHLHRAHILIDLIDTGERIDVTATESDAFWAWAVIETLRHTGVRIEELLELTHLALVSYRLPDTGEVVPLLQVVPSKSNEERLLLVGPELASVLATIVTRLRAVGEGAVPLTARYDPYEQTTGPQLPHLFQRPIGARFEVMSNRTIQKLLTVTLAHTGIRDLAGAPLHYTPHDFRRMFATEAVTGGLPVHIAAKILGHHHLSTTQAYLAVFQDDLIRTYRGFLDRRRAVRPETEYREPTDDEWREFHQHFQRRKLELGTCGRPYGTPCKHEHACIRCPMLQVDPAQANRLAEIARNLTERIDEARANGWLGEVEGLQVSLNAARSKIASLERQRVAAAGTSTFLGTPRARAAPEDSSR